MTTYHDEVEIEDFEYDEETETYYFPCPCGDRFEITKHGSTGSTVNPVWPKLYLAGLVLEPDISGSVTEESHEMREIVGTTWMQIKEEDLANGEDEATCPSCSLIVKVIYDIEDFMEGEKVPEISQKNVEVAT